MNEQGKAIKIIYNIGFVGGCSDVKNTVDAPRKLL